MTTPDPFAPPPPSPPAGPPTEPYTPPPAAAQASTAPRVAPSAAGIRQPQAGLVIGAILVVVGAVFLVGRVLDLAVGPDAWPLWIILPGVGMFLAALAIPARGGVGLAIAGSIVTMVGLILWFQDANDLFETWAYAWALVAPTGPGLGMLLYGLVKGDRELVRDGLRTTLVGLGLFAGFALFFEGVIGLTGNRIPGLEDAPFIHRPRRALVVLSLFGRRDTPASA
jgi:hypothetical protein